MKMHSKAYSKLCAARMRAKWADPVYRKNQVRVATAGKQTPAARRNRSLANKKMWQNPEARKHFSDGAKKRWARPDQKALLIERRSKQVFTPAYRRKLSEHMKRQWADPVARAKRIASVTAAHLRPEVHQRNINRIKKEWSSPCLYVRGACKIKMHCWWEVALAEWYTKQGIRWRYEPARFYVGRGAYRGYYYIPDFYLPDTDEYVEVKGIEPPRVKAKLRKFKKLYPSIKITILRLPQLTSMGVLRKRIAVLSSSAAARRQDKRDGIITVTWEEKVA